MVASSHHLEEELDTDPHFSEKLNPDFGDADPQPRLKPAMSWNGNESLLDQKFLSHTRNYVLECYIDNV